MNEFPRWMSREREGRGVVPFVFASNPCSWNGKSLSLWLQSSVIISNPPIRYTAPPLLRVGWEAGIFGSAGTLPYCSHVKGEVVPIFLESFFIACRYLI